MTKPHDPNKVHQPRQSKALGAGGNRPRSRIIHSGPSPWPAEEQQQIADFPHWRDATVRLGTLTAAQEDQRQAVARLAACEVPTDDDIKNNTVVYQNHVRAQSDKDVATRKVDVITRRDKVCPPGSAAAGALTAMDWRSAPEEVRHLFRQMELQYRHAPAEARHLYRVNT